MNYIPDWGSFTSINLNLISIIKSELCPWNPFTSINLNYVIDSGPFTSINLNYVPNWSNYHAYNLALDFLWETKLYQWKYSISIVRIKGSRALRPWPMFCKLVWLLLRPKMVVVFQLWRCCTSLLFPAVVLFFFLDVLVGNFILL